MGGLLQQPQETLFKIYEPSVDLANAASDQHMIPHPFVMKVRN